MASSALIKAIAATAELCGKTFTPAAATMLASDLEGFDENAVMAALTRCRKELDGKPFNVAAIISRIEDGRPGPEEAWAMLPHDESSSTVWTEEMASAWGIASPLIQDGDRVGGRMAFKEAYVKLITQARDQKIAPRWIPSFGTDVRGRQAALIEAVRHKRLSVNSAVALLPAEAAEGLLITFGVKGHPLLAAPNKDAQKKIAGLLSLIGKKGD